jgi:RNase P/RNase MRP subunit POP5/DNA-binding transcriptional regulator GbsR (MarR family)
MRTTIRPVSLSRIAEVVEVCSHQDLDVMEIGKKLGASSDRVNEILAEMDRMNIVAQEDVVRLTDNGRDLYKSIEEEDWRSVHSVLYTNSPHYSTFIDLLKQQEEEQGLTEEQILNEIKQIDSGLQFNKTGISLLTDWAERLEAIQKNVFQGRYYWVSNDTDVDFAEVLQNHYSDMEVERGVNLRQRYISIPRLRETVCEALHITRSEFDELLTEVYFNNIGEMELSGAPLNTQAKETSIGIKSIEKNDDGAVTTTKVSSNQVLEGLTLDDGKIYYYLSIFNELNGDV